MTEAGDGRRPGRMDGPRRRRRVWLPARRHRRPRAGASIQARLYAEDPRAGLPAQQRRAERRWLSRPRRARRHLDRAAAPRSARYYDPLLAKLIVTAPDRAAAVRALQEALDGNAPCTAWRPTSSGCARSRARMSSTRAASHHRLAGGRRLRASRIRRRQRRPATTVQDYPGRVGYWDVGRAAVGPDGRAGLPAGQPPARQSGRRRRPGDHRGSARRCAFNTARGLCLTGARLRRQPRRPARRAYGAIASAPGRRCELGAVQGAGPARLPAALRGGLDVPRLSGQPRDLHAGPVRRPRRAGAGRRRRAAPGADGSRRRAQRPGATPHVPHAARSRTTGTLGVLYGPHGAPDFFTAGRHRRCSSAPPGRCTTTPAAPASA